MLGISNTYLVLAFLGMLTHILVKVLQRKDKSKKISLSYFFSDSSNWIRIMLAIISTISILLMADDLANMLHVQLSDGSPAKSLLSFLAGYLNHSIIKTILSIFNKKNKEECYQHNKRLKNMELQPKPELQIL